MIDKFLKDKFKVFILLTIVLAAFLRFVNYGNRWGLAYDQAHDAILARYAVDNLLLPLVGPFASGAQFQTSGIWYWFLMLATIIYPNSILTPWIVITLSYVAFVFLMIIIGKELVSKRFGILVGLLTAISTAQITQATNLTLTAPMGFVSALAILSVIRYSNTRKIRYIFLLGLSVGLAPTVHLQGVLLILFLPVSVLILKIKSPKLLGILLIGLLLPSIPLLIFDLKNNFVNSLGLLNYFLHDQYRTSYEVLDRRWLTYITVFWPKSWALIIGGYSIVAYLSIFVLAVALVDKFIKRNLDKLWLIFLISFMFMITAMRYVRNPLFDSYLVFLHPFILLFTALAIFWLYKKNVYLSILLLVVVLIGSLQRDYLDIVGATNNTYIEAKKMERILINKIPNKKFYFYDFNYKTTSLSVPLTMLLYKDNKISDNGIRIGMFSSTISAKLSFFKIYGKDIGYQIFNLNSSTSAQLKSDGWVLINPSKIYNSTENWYSKKNK